jgi:hypothetical protein
MPAPTDRKGVMRLLGVTTYMARFCPHSSDVTKPIRALLARENEFAWRHEQEAAFDRVKELLLDAPSLAYYDVNKPVTVQCDASQTGLGAVIMSNDGQPIEFASRALTAREVEYAQIEKELFAILFALQRFDTYVYARNGVKVETDHKPLLAIHKKALSAVPKRLQRMLMQLQRYNYELIYKPGTQMVISDTLSRAHPPVKGKRDKTGQPSTYWDELAAVTDDAMTELRMVASKATIRSLSEAVKADKELIPTTKGTNTVWVVSGIVSVEPVTGSVRMAKHTARGNRKHSCTTAVREKYSFATPDVRCGTSNNIVGSCTTSTGKV